MNPQRFAVLALCGILVLGGWAAAGLSDFDSRAIENGELRAVVDAPRAAETANEPVGDLQALDARSVETAPPASAAMTAAAGTATQSTSEAVQHGVEAAASAVEVAETESTETGVSESRAIVSLRAPTVARAPERRPESVQDSADAVAPSRERAETEIVTAALPASPETPPQAALPTFVPRRVPSEEALQPPAHPVEIPSECLVTAICIDDYLWALYERTPKVDMNKVVERMRVMVRKKGKVRTVVRSVTKYVVGDFTWKDPMAAQRAAMSVKDYVIGGMDRRFKLKLYTALRAMDEAGFMPGITSAFRDDYRQSIASGKKAASDSSYHGGSRRGGYGHGLAADLVSVKGETRLERFAASVEMWKWIDAHETELGVGRPYLDRDPPHVGPIDGEEYAVKRHGVKVRLAASATSGRHSVAVHGSAEAAKPATTAGSVRMGSN